MLFVGDDWAEDHHDLEIVDDQGRRLARRRLPEGAAGVGELHALIADHLDEDAEPDQVVIGIETERGPWVRALRAGGYQVFAINPMQVARYRERHSTSGAKSDRADAHVLAELVRLDRDHHRPVAEDSAEAEAVKVLARAHQNLVWARQRQLNQLRSTLREFYPAALAAFGSDLGSRDALAVLAAAPTPEAGRALDAETVTEILREAGRRRNLTTRAETITQTLIQNQLEQPQVLADAYGASVRSLVAVLTQLTRQAGDLESEVSRCFGRHPDAEIYRSQPGLGQILGARALAEFGDAPERYRCAKARKNYAGTSPITRASGKKTVVAARFARNRRLADVLYLQAFAALTASPGARAYYDTLRARGTGHHDALRRLGNRLVGILHGCLKTGTLYNEATAWPSSNQEVAQAA